MPYKDPEKAREWKRKWRKANPEKEREHYRKYYAKNREKKLENRREYYAENRAKERERNRKYKEANREKNREYLRKYREANLDKLRECRSEYYAKNYEKMREYDREWKKANPEKVREYSRKYSRKYYAANRDTILAKLTPEQKQRWHDLCAERTLERKLERTHRDHALGVIKCKAPKKTDTEFVTPGVPDWIEREMADRERSRKVSAARAEFRKEHRGQVPR